MSPSKQIHIGSLIGKYLTGKESKSESSELKAWLEDSPKNRKLFDELKNDDNIGLAIDELEIHNKELAWEKYKDRISALSLKRIMFVWKVAAVFFFLVSCSGVMVMLIKNNKARTILNETYTTISTTNGQKSKIILPDSSVVWINSGTKLSYNSNFSAFKREIKLQGQAYFQVTKNLNMPLTVFCNNLEVKVLGTTFDLNAYNDNNQIFVVLEYGRIELINALDKTLIYSMKPGEKAEFDTEYKKLSVRNVNRKEYAIWKDGLLVFKNEKMDLVFKELERWYNIHIEVKDERVKNLVFNATIVNENVEEIFELIRFSCGIKYKIIPSKNPDIPVKVIISN